MGADEQDHLDAYSSGYASLKDRNYFSNNIFKSTNVVLVISLHNEVISSSLNNCHPPTSIMFAFLLQPMIQLSMGLIELHLQHDDQPKPQRQRSIRP
jgi:hypothetical protein